jgi:hypothetical protein
MIARFTSSMRRTTLAAVALAAVVGGCSNQAPTSERGPVGAPAPSTMGAIDIGLAVPPKFQVATINYQIANTSTGYNRSGTLDVSKTAVISSVVGGIPAGTGYKVALTATDTGQKFTGCSGSSSLVNVVGGTTTPVSVAVDCHLPQANLTPTVPVPTSAVALLALALLAAGGLAAGRRGAGRSPRS